MDPITLTIGSRQITFAELTAWDAINARKQVRQEVAGQIFHDPYELALAMLWLSARNGGCTENFDVFAKAFPVAQFAEVNKALRPLVSLQAAPEVPSA